MSTKIVTNTRLDLYFANYSAADFDAQLAAAEASGQPFIVVNDLSRGPAVIYETADEATRYYNPTTPEIAAKLSLRRAAFFLALDSALGLTSSDALVHDYVKAQIEATAALTAEQKRAALTLLLNATTFYRADPDQPGLLDAVGAILGLSSSQIDDLFIGAQ